EDCNQKQWSAINEQIAREIQADLSQILPRLHGINSRMGDMRGDYSSLHDNPQFSEFKGLIGDLSTSLSSVPLGRDVEATQSIMASSPHRRSTNLKRKRSHEVRPPSRERKQVRQPSYKT
ncbi:hypothetical protein V5O48_012117, partial [Marasmius crinis-equi]